MYVLGVDFGGGASKATLLEETGKVVATATSEYKTITVGENGREQNPEDWYNATKENIRAVIKKSKINGKEIAALCFDAATHTAVLTDENGKPVMNSVYWTDTRSVKEKKYLEEKYGKEIFRKFKHNVDTIWTLPQLMWVKENKPEEWKRVKRITFAKDYVRGKFTGDFVTDYIEAEGSMLFDYDTMRWDEKFISLIGITEENLPKIVTPLTVTGKVKKEIAEEFGFDENVKVICGATDTAMEVFAAGAIKKGQTTLKLATAGRICVVNDKLAPDKNVINYSHVIKGLYYPGTATKSCAASLRWFRDAFGGDYAEYDEEAKKIPVGSDGLIFHPYLSGELTPYANPMLKGSFTGITGAHTKGHFARAVMEGVAMSMKDCKDYLDGLGVKIESAFIIGGGAKSDVWSGMIADALQIKLIKTENNDSSFGSAMLAGIAAGFFKDPEEAIEKCSVKTGEILPDKERGEEYAKLFIRYKKIQKALEEIYNA